MRKLLSLLILAVSCPLAAHAAQLSNRAINASVRAARGPEYFPMAAGEVQVIARSARQAKVLFATPANAQLHVATVSSSTGKILQQTGNLMPSVRRATRVYLNGNARGIAATLDDLAKPLVRASGAVRINVYSDPYSGGGGAPSRRSAYTIRVNPNGKLGTLRQAPGSTDADLR